ncbi:Ribosome-associated inhibitor A [Vibrio stylophorae]|uniref:Ribosome-associated inhibitor A n=1 Tax=Vibrio stylophorae TaxID=659351 RepID=A0ABN8DWA0_9VIBR|nr:ribosome-associated translation inhibitor RaiA [Vibrio stylophorae]CAH0534307.1 Ribosome-associated inhibitor A [Vibrio stylophorae]
MTVEITGKGITITPAIRERVEARLEKLEKWHVPLINPRAIISKEPTNRVRFECKVAIPNGQLIASESDEELQNAIHAVFQKLERQLNKQSHKPDARRATHHEQELIEEEA